MRLQVTNNIMRSSSVLEINYYIISNNNQDTFRHLLDVTKGLFYDNGEFLIVPIASGPPTLPNYHPAFLPALHLSQNPAPLEKITQEGTPNQETNPVAESNSNM